MARDPKPAAALIPRGAQDLTALAQQYARRSHAESTWSAYRADWERFCAWCEQAQVCPCPAPPQAIANYVIDMARTRQHSVRYIRRAVSAIGWAHVAAGHDPPPTKLQSVRLVILGVMREHGAPARKSWALSGFDLRALLAACPGDSLADKRDRALLCLGFFAALRRSELVALRREDVREVPGGLEVTLRRSKTDKEGKGETKGVKKRKGPTDPVALVRDWLEASGIRAGPLFRPINRHGQPGEAPLTGRSVALIVKRTCDKAGLDPEHYSGHSLRRGFATSASRGGADGTLIRQQTRHKSDRMVAEYIEEGNRFGRHAQDYIDTGDKGDEET